MQRTDEPDRRTEWLRLRHELAGLRFEQALLKAELKYRADQAREPAGQPTGGRFTSGSGSAAAHPARGFLAPPVAAAGVAARTGVSGAAALPGMEAAALGPVGLGAIAGGIGVSRTAGLVARGPNGSGGLTPILHLPLSTLTPGMPIAVMASSSQGKQSLVPAQKLDEICEEQLKEDHDKCQFESALYGRTPDQKREIYAICHETAMDRYGECLAGGPAAVKSPLYNARFHNSGRGPTDSDKAARAPRKSKTKHAALPRNVSLLHLGRKKP